MKILDTHWRNLLVVSYRVEAGMLDLLNEQLPAGTVLDDYRGEHYVSVVAFEFQKTRVLGIAMPIYRDFAEVNLRFYVKRMVDGEWRRGVVFIREIVPCRLPALVANMVFKENFHIRPLRSEVTVGQLRYEWREAGGMQEMAITRENELSDPEPGSLIEHIIDHYWAYKRISPNTTGEFSVEHRPWKVRQHENSGIRIDIGQIYGPRWAAALASEPVHTFYADGSRVLVTKPEKIKI